MNKNINPSLLFLLFLIPLISASDGDRSPFYQNCLKSCKKANCTSDGEFTAKALKLQDPWSELLQWGCSDECRYHCMWRTVQGFQERGYSIPKFHGKWPFKRVLGLQEPAAVYASLLNLATTVYMYTELWRQFSVRDSPLVLFWHVFAMVCMNAWTWSTIFHARDTPFTEFMDYACALSMVMSLFIAAVIRIFHRRRRLTAAVVACSVLYLAAHARYLHTGRFDYEYNMRVNIFFGVAGGALWSWWAWRVRVRGARHTWRLLAFSAWSGAALALELLDAPPVRGWDAHALWHLATAPLPLLFYRFVIDDLKYLQNPLPREKSDLKLT